MASQKRSMTGLLRELHLQLDADAPKHMPLDERRKAIGPLLAGLGSVGEAIQDAVEAATDGQGGDSGSTSNTGRSSEGETRRRAGTRTGDGTGKPQGQASGQPRREARGVRVVTPDAPQPITKPKPVTRKPVEKPSGESTASKLWRLLIG